MTGPLSIVQINAVDEGGGAAAVSTAMMCGYRARGHRVHQFVGRKRTRNPDVERTDGSVLLRLADRFPGRGLGLVARAARGVRRPESLRTWWLGLEDFDFPSTAGLLDRCPTPPDIVHAHNLHGGYFDLRALAAISVRVPTLVTLHDMWMFTGHCAHARGCDGWRSGCPTCPDLDAYPAIRRDGASRNWERKRRIFAQSRVHVATPSEWLRERVAASMLMPAVKSLRVIPNGVDTRRFRPADRQDARRALNLPPEQPVVMLTAGIGRSMWKDARMIEEATRLLAQNASAPLTFLPAGESPPMELRYQAADVYLHASLADSGPLAVLEAMASGAVVIATDVGGIGEQVQDGVTGALVPAGQPSRMAEAADALLRDEPRRRAMADAAVARVRAQFSIDGQVEAYLACYQEMLQ